MTTSKNSFLLSAGMIAEAQNEHPEYPETTNYYAIAFGSLAYLATCLIEGSKHDKEWAKEELKRIIANEKNRSISQC